MAEDKQNKNLTKVLEDVGEDLVKTLVKNLIAADKKATGKLIKSVDYKLVQKANNIIVELTADAYLKNVDEGRRAGAKQPPLSALDKWVVARKIAPRDSKGKFLPRQQVKFLIARSIAKNGIKPTNVIKKTLDEVYKNKEKLITEAAGKDLEALIAMTFKEIK
jgi:hypothetical protein